MKTLLISLLVNIVGREKIIFPLIFSPFLLLFLGVVTDLLGIFASQVALGKSHTCILTQHGTIFTFGNNLFGQCGRDYVPPKEAFDGNYILTIVGGGAGVLGESLFETPNFFNLLHRS